MICLSHFSQDKQNNIDKLTKRYVNEGITVDVVIESETCGGKVSFFFWYIYDRS